MGLLLPKLGKRLKKRRKRIARRSKFKTKDHPFKVYHQRHSPAETEEYAKRCAAEQLAKPTEAVKRLEAELRTMGVFFKREKILHNWATGAWCYVDFWLPDHRIVIELDGKQHGDQPKYDATRDRWITEFTGFRVCRYWNEWALKAGLRERVAALLNEG